MSAGSPQTLEEPWAICRAGLSATWKLGLAGGLLVGFLSWSSGTLPFTSVIRGGITLLALGLIGWGINAVLLAAGPKAGSAEERDTASDDAPSESEAIQGEEESDAQDDTDSL